MLLTLLNINITCDSSRLLAVINNLRNVLLSISNKRHIINHNAILDYINRYDIKSKDDGGTSFKNEY